MKSLIASILKRPRGTLMLTIALLTGGIWAGFNMRLDFLPDFSVPKLTVIAPYKGLPAEEIREIITIPLEDSLSSLGGLKNMKSISRDGLCLIELEFPWGTDRLLAGIETRDVIDTAYLSLPSDASKPSVLPVDPGDMPVIVLGVYPRSGDLCLARRLSERELRSRLQRIEGVGSVQISGGLQEEIHIEADPLLLTGRGYNLSDLGSALGDANIDYPAGTITEGRTEYLVKTKARASNLRELRAIYLLSSESGGEEDQAGALHLGDLAEISWGTKKQESFFYCKTENSPGREGIRLLIRRQGGYSPREMALNISSEIEDLKKSFGRDLELQILLDRSASLNRSLKDLAGSLMLGSIIAFFVILLFLRSLQQALILLLTLPASLMTSLLMLLLCGRSLNLMSLGGLAIGVGMVIDNAIVVTERLSRQLVRTENYHQRLVLIAEITSQLAPPLAGSTLTTVIVFIPLFFIPGLAGSLFGDLAMGVIFALAASLLLSFTAIPVLYLLLNPASGRKDKGGNSGFLRRVIKNSFRRPLLTGILAGVFCLSGLLLASALPREVISPINEKRLSCKLQMPPGTSMKTMKALAADITEKIVKNPQIREIHAWCGGEPGDPYYLSSSSEAPEILQLRLICESQNNREALTSRLQNLIRVEVGSFTILPEENILENLLGISSGTDWTLSGDEPEKVRAAAAALLSGQEGAVLRELGAALEPSEKRRLLKLYPDREALSALGISLPQLSRQLGLTLFGSVQTSIIKDGREIDVRLWTSTENRRNRDDITEIALPGSGWAPVSLGKLAELREESALPFLLRENRKDLALIHFKTQPDGTAIEILKKAGGTASGTSVLRQQFKDIFLVFTIALLLLYLCLGIQFESFGLPLLLMLSIPMGIGGISLALLLSSESINLNSSLGMLVLMGISVNNGILLFEESRTILKRQGRSLTSALYLGTVSRLRPILMTSLTTILALLPLAIDPVGKSSQSSLAVSIIGGLTASTLLSLLLLPQIFRIKRNNG